MTRLSVVATVALMLLGCSGSNAAAPATFRVNMETSRGLVVIEVTRADAPIGADRFYDLVKAKYFDGARFFRVVKTPVPFVVQFGLAADPALSKKWDIPIQDDPVKQPNARGTLVFAATNRPNSRTQQLFINLGDNPRLDQIGFAPFGKVLSGMEFVDQITDEYGEQPNHQAITEQGNAYLQKEFPKLDFIKTATIAPAP
jgi:peptidyl-prolyl cis-trans isomerase A (cyclophilin A)